MLYRTLKNSILIIHEENTKKITNVLVVYVIKFHVIIYIYFSFDFLGLDNVDFKNYFANELINMGCFLSHLKHYTRTLNEVRK